MKHKSVRKNPEPPPLQIDYRGKSLETIVEEALHRAMPSHGTFDLPGYRRLLWALGRATESAYRAAEQQGDIRDDLLEQVLRVVALWCEDEVPIGLGHWLQIDYPAPNDSIEYSLHAVQNWAREENVPWKPGDSELRRAYYPHTRPAWQLLMGCYLLLRLMAIGTSMPHRLDVFSSGSVLGIMRTQILYVLATWTKLGEPPLAARARVEREIKAALRGTSAVRPRAKRRPVS